MALEVGPSLPPRRVKIVKSRWTLGTLADAMVWTVTEFGLLVVRCLLAATFLTAGTAKLTNRRAAMQALRDFGAPRFAQPLFPLLPPVEIAVGAGFLFAASAWYAAWAAGGLLVIFIAGIAANLARGRQPPCNCFGQLRAKPIGWQTLARNGVLAACATWLIVSGPPQSAADLWVLLSRLDTRGQRVAMVLAAVIVATIMHVLGREAQEPAPETAFVDEPESAGSRHRAAPVATLDGGEVAPEWAAPENVLTGNGLAIGTLAPGFALPDLEGHPHSLDSLRASGKPVLLLFSSPHCQSCQALAPKLPGLAALHEHAFRMVVISRGSVQQNLVEKGKDPGQLLILLQQQGEVTDAYDCTSTPAAVLVDADGVIQSPLAVGAPAITQLISLRSKP
ncbi:MAG: MauE/DoxX family redox-associated membrane protein [Acidobacteriota bacterium]